MPFEGLEAMTHLALVPLEGLHELLMTTGHHPTGPPVVGGSPPQDLFLELGDAGDRHGPLPLRPRWGVLLGQALLDTKDVTLSAPARSAIIVAPGKKAPPDAWAAGDDTPPRMSGASRGAAMPGARQTGCGKSPPRRWLGLLGAANRRGSDTRLPSQGQTWPVTARRPPPAAPASWGAPLPHSSGSDAR